MHIDNTNYHGKVAVITGAAAGLGAALADYAGKLGMKLLLVDIDQHKLEQSAASLRSVLLQETVANQRDTPLDIQTVIVDVSDDKAVQMLADDIHGSWGPVGLLINNAGIETIGYSWETPPQQWQKIMGVNVQGAINTVCAFTPHMIESDSPSKILNITSIAGVSVSPLQAPYIVSKHAALSYTECLHIELAKKAPHIQVSAALPGPIDSNIFTALEENKDPLAEDHRKSMIHMLEQHGMPPSEAAALIFEQLHAGDFWISTHPEMMQTMADARARSITQQLEPAVDWQQFDTYDEPQ